MLGYSDLVSVNDYHQKAQFSGFKGYKVNLKVRQSITISQLNAYKLCILIEISVAIRMAKKFEGSYFGLV